MKTSNVVISLIAGILAGAAAGAALGILYAPDKGTETRRKITRKGEELRDNLRHKFEGVKEEASELLDKGKSKIYEAMGDMNRDMNTSTI
jgi:gas vesicle protein